jgi:hypothetical protein
VPRWVEVTALCDAEPRWLCTACNEPVVGRSCRCTRKRTLWCAACGHADDRHGTVGYDYAAAADICECDCGCRARTFSADRPGEPAAFPYRRAMDLKDAL